MNNLKGGKKYKFLLIGDPNVGKSCILVQYVDGKFQEGTQNTIGQDSKEKSINVNGKETNLVIWDTAGQERFRTLTSSFYRGAHGIIIVFDITNHATFQNVDRWKQEIIRYTSDVPRIIIGNKSDKESERKVTKEEAEKYCSENGIPYMECSAKTGSNIEEMFEKLAKEVVKIMEPTEPQHFPIQSEDKKSCCNK
eukprot:TRINITY_DN118_c1_g1_i1.p1 TRINITY_DN118_c1_g1~~TRINITY_DN118_c1_g1_i1.p1  ORF type:complete len:195 (-),score=40.82 TRINITY_DN118_c1_g1_i1:63-647(-)